MYVSEVVTTFEMIEKVMNMPSWVKVVAVQEGEHRGMVKIRIASDTPPPEYFEIRDITKIGEAYREPEKYKATPMSGKGQTIGERLAADAENQAVS